MKVQDILQETYTALSANKARSGLTILGIVIGIGSVIVMVSIGQGASGQITSSIEGLGSNLLTVSPGVAYISPERQGRYQIVAAGNNTNSTVIGVSPEYAMVRNISVADGSFITEANMRSLGRVAVLGPTVAQDLFGEGNDPVGKTVRINRLNFKVIGVLQAKGSAGLGFNPDDTVYVPLTTMQKVLAGGDYLSSIAISVETKDLMPQVQQEASLALADKHRVDPASPDFSILSQSDILGTLTQVTDTFTIFLAAVAGISLIVGGIGIMNMMLTTVTERTREIGLRKAIGAKSRHISRQFLTEAIMLTFLGGAVGVALGWIISILVSRFAGIATTVSMSSVLLAFGVSAAIGIVFGYYPARRAASLNPIEALRYE